MEKKLSNWEIFVLVIIIIFVLILIIYIIFSFFEHRTNIVGEICLKDNDCGSGLYCSGENKCHPGIEGKKTGAICVINSECQVNSLCIPDENNISRCTPVVTCI